MRSVPVNADGESAVDRGQAMDGSVTQRCLPSLSLDTMPSCLIRTCCAAVEPDPQFGLIVGLVAV